MTQRETTSSEVVDLPAMKRADRIRRERELEYSRRDMRCMLAIVGLGVALVYTSFWLISVMFG